MSLILLISITIRLFALGWSIVLLRRIRDWRMGVLSVMLALMALRQILTLWEHSQSVTSSVTSQITELPGLAVSVLAFLAVIFVERVIIERQQKDTAIQSILDTTVDGIITIDEQGTVETFNPAAERIFGYRSDQVIGNNVNMLMPEPYHSEHDGYVTSYLRTGSAKIIGIGREVVGLRKDRTTFPMDLAVSKFRVGNRRMFTGIVRDITERRRTEEALHESQQSLSTLMSNLPGMAYRCRNDMHWTMGIRERGLS